MITDAGKNVDLLMKIKFVVRWNSIINNNKKGNQKWPKKEKSEESFRIFASL